MLRYAFAAVALLALTEAYLAQERGFLAQERGLLAEERGFLAEERGFLAQERGFLGQERGYFGQGGNFGQERAGFDDPDTLTDCQNKFDDHISKYLAEEFYFTPDDGRKNRFEDRVLGFGLKMINDEAFKNKVSESQIQDMEAKLRHCIVSDQGGDDILKSKPENMIKALRCGRLTDSCEKPVEGSKKRSCREEYKNNMEMWFADKLCLLGDSSLVVTRKLRRMALDMIETSPLTADQKRESKDRANNKDCWKELKKNEDFGMLKALRCLRNTNACKKQ